MKTALCVAAAAALSAVPASGAPSARVQVVAREFSEFSFALSRGQVRAGRVTIELANFGEDVHDLRLRRLGGTRTLRIGVVEPGRQGELSARLIPGRYALWCSIADHRSRGMRAVLVVRGSGRSAALWSRAVQASSGNAKPMMRLSSRALFKSN